MQTPVEASKAGKVLDRHRQMKAHKQIWINDYELVATYVMRRRGLFTSTDAFGSFTSTEIYDNTAATANQSMCSSLLGALWPNGSRSFLLQPPDSMPKSVRCSKPIKEFYQRISDKVRAAFDNPQANWRGALGEYMNDQGAFGISAIFVEDNTQEDPQTPTIYRAVDAKKLAIAENKHGDVDTVYMERSLTIRQLVMEYGVENVSEASRAIYNNNADLEQKVTVLEAIEPRLDGVKDGFGNQSMPIACIHIETASNHILYEGGYQQMPIFVCRFWKRMGEIYGRSPALEALPEILEINAMREALILAVEKKLDPPLALMDDGVLGGGVLDTSAGAINVFHPSSSTSNRNQPPVIPVVTVGELDSTYKRLPELKENIEQSFLIDRLTDLNNDSRMTKYETMQRKQLRSEALNDVYSRQMDEELEPCINRTVDIMYNAKLFGVIHDSPEDIAMQQQGMQDIEYIPDEVIDLINSGQHAYKVKWLSPAARAMQEEELAGIQNSLQFTSTYIAPFSQNVWDNYDLDFASMKAAELEGAPDALIRSDEEIAAIRKARSDQQAQAAKAQSDELGAKTLKSGAQAAHAGAQAGIPPQALPQFAGALLNGGNGQQQQAP